MNDSASNARVFRMLLVEDSPLDVMLVQQALLDSPNPIELSIARDGEAATSFLEKSSSPRIDLILLDLNLPLKNGMEVLREVRASKQLALLPIVIFTTSNADEHINSAYIGGANAYVRKPIDADEFMKKIKALVEFWAYAAALPKIDGTLLR